MKTLNLLLLLFLFTQHTVSYSYEFENTTCTIIGGKSESEPTVVTSIKIGKVIHLDKTKANKYGVWKEDSNSDEFVPVSIYIINGAANHSLYRIINEKLYQSFPTNDSQYAFRRIVPNISPKIGRFDDVRIKGSSLKLSLLNTISCEKNIFN